ncbi:FAD-binding oxidoreductase [Streptacidiphilus anmyonensis]|uniref:FAD-binding oxidoreductase n=1 Tax=Streptacidiphilus anmyonensis TaxID=405782 RepID=UPI000A02389F|nr:FAD-binding protein [Streptacidiphilus anmyonensis]
MAQHPDQSPTRRQILTTAGGLAVGTAAAVSLGAPPAAASTPQGGPDDAGTPEPTAFGPVTVEPGDPRYESLLRGDNFRFVGSPDEIRVCGSTEQVVRAVADAVRSGRQVAARSGGHCFEDFTAAPSVRMLLDLSPMDAVGYDPRRRAFAVQPGATLGRVYTTLFKGWGVTVPAGGCPEVGAGGHFVGGGYGPLSRRYGSVVDHLYGVEVVVVDKDGSARAVVATREPDDPHGDLFWAHTGGGGGNFGIVTRYWLRSPGASGDDPTRLLPPSPKQMRAFVLTWSWKDLDERRFTTLLRNFCTWHEENSTPGAPGTGLYNVLMPMHRSAGSFIMLTQMDADLPDADQLLEDFYTALVRDTGPAPTAVPFTSSWLHATTWPGTGEGGDIATRRYKLKAAYLRRSFTDVQLSAIYAHLTDKTGDTQSGMLLVGYGGQVQSVPPQATAVAQRDVVMKAVFQSIWYAESDDATHLAWVRGLYHDVFAATGGAPVPDAVAHGSYINYPDVDLADPALNTSGVPWSTLYYGDNYPRLQRVKARWDPRNVFRHALSIEPPI